MQIDERVSGLLSAIPERVRDAEGDGYDGLWVAEADQDPFLMALLASEHSERADVGTGIVVAFARSPMTTAHSAWDLNVFSGGRFVLGLGSQVKPHIERRFSMPWSHPARRMREYILALHAIWDCWQNGTKLDFRGEFYTHTLMLPMFSAQPSRWGAPRVFLAAVGRLMTQVAGEVADGLRVHSFTTERYLREVTLPAVEEGLAIGGRPRSAFQVAYPSFVVTGETEQQRDAADRGTRNQLAFYASTPAYRPVLELHGWGDLQLELNGLAKRGAWEEMGRLIDDDILNAFAVVDVPERVPGRLVERFGGVVDRLSLYMPYDDPDRQLGRRILGGLRANALEDGAASGK